MREPFWATRLMEDGSGGRAYEGVLIGELHIAPGRTEAFKASFQACCGARHEVIAQMIGRVAAYADKKSQLLNTVIDVSGGRQIHKLVQADQYLTIAVFTQSGEPLIQVVKNQQVRAEVQICYLDCGIGPEHLDREFRSQQIELSRIAKATLQDLGHIGANQ